MTRDESLQDCNSKKNRPTNARIMCIMQSFLIIVNASLRYNYLSNDASTWSDRDKFLFIRSRIMSIKERSRCKCPKLSLEEIVIKVKRRGAKKNITDSLSHFAEETGSLRILHSAHGARNDAKTHLSQRPAIAATIALFAAKRSHRCSAVI